MIRFKEEFEDTKGLIRIRISKKNRQHNGRQKINKRTNNDLQNIQKQLNTYRYSTRGRRGRDRMVVGFTTTYATSAYHH